MLTHPKTYKISVIIVNYNVEFFLEQCLNSVKKALERVSGEVFIVDNNSIDGSVDMVSSKFPEYHLIANKDNRGFSKANNQAIKKAKGEYILLLNPDTVVEEDTFEKVCQFLDQHPDAGGLGVRMLDGRGKFLPESKRGLPTPAVAFHKIFGISRLFPKSQRFGKYHLGHLSEFEINEIDILSGAFMLMRSSALDKVGLLDEAFFMYGEDIDLSYRIKKGGYKNYYFPNTRIIHYKGESTKKSSVNYVFVFYRAMVIFAEKHFSQKNAKLFSLLINGAIYFRAFLALLTRFIKKTTLPIVDSAYLLAGLFALTTYWKHAHIDFPDEILKYSIPGYTLIWMSSIFFTAGYDSPTKLFRFLKGAFIGTLLILIIYALLPKNWQFSRLYILIGAAWVSSYYLISRLFLHFFLKRRFNLTQSKNKKFVIVGSKEESERVSQLLRQTNSRIDEISCISATEKKEEGTIGTLNQLDQVVHIHSIDEIIFCAKDTSAQAIIQWMSSISSDLVDFKIAQPESLFLIGSNSIETAGDLYILNLNSITTKSNVRNKRTFDFMVALSLLLFTPLSILFYRKKKKFMKNLFSILFGEKSVVGYHYFLEPHTIHLPKIKAGILSPADKLLLEDSSMTDKLNLLYARDYSLFTDFSILRKAWKKLDQ
jgi:O-antigen biosynthesis protein